MGAFHLGKSFGFKFRKLSLSSESVFFSIQTKERCVFSSKLAISSADQKPRVIISDVDVDADVMSFRSKLKLCQVAEMILTLFQSLLRRVAVFPEGN